MATLKEERRRLSESLQRWIFDRFVMLDAKGDRRTLTQIFADARGELPPAGAGECAAPKLLQYAYVNGYRPLAMGEFWVGCRPSASCVATAASTVHARASVNPY